MTHVYTPKQLLRRDLRLVSSGFTSWTKKEVTADHKNPVALAHQTQTDAPELTRAS